MPSMWTRAAFWQYWIEDRKSTTRPKHRRIGLDKVCIVFRSWTVTILMLCMAILIRERGINVLSFSSTTSFATRCQ